MIDEFNVTQSKIRSEAGGGSRELVDGLELSKYDLNTPKLFHYCK